MIDENKLDLITSFLKDKIFRNGSIMWIDNLPSIELEKSYTDDDGDEVSEVDLVDIIASLHNLLYEAVTGERYDYMWHWANKCGSWCNDNVFDNDIFEKENNNV